MLHMLVCFEMFLTVVFLEIFVTADTSVMALTSVICMPNVGEARRFWSPAAAIAWVQFSSTCLDRLHPFVKDLPQNLHLNLGTLMT